MLEKFKVFITSILFVINIECAFYIRNTVEPNFVLDLADMNPCANAMVIMCPATNKPSQMWEFYNLTMIRNVYSGYFLDIKGNFGAGSELIVWPGHGGKNQQWVLQTDQTIKNQNGLYADIADNMRDPGAQVIAFYHTGQNNQRFEFVGTT